MTASHGNKIHTPRENRRQHWLLVVYVSEVDNKYNFDLTRKNGASGCLNEAPMRRVGNHLYRFLDRVNQCGNLDGATATVTSSGGGSATATIR